MQITLPKKCDFIRKKIKKGTNTFLCLYGAVYKETLKLTFGVLCSAKVSTSSIELVSELIR